MTPEQLAKITARVANLEPRVDGIAEDEITALDICHALGCLKSQHSAAVKTKVCPEYAMDLLRELRAEYRTHHKGGAAEKIEALLWLVIQTYIHNNYCPTCRGRGQIPENLSDGAHYGNYSMVLCPECSGEQIKRMTDGQMARWVGVSYQDWKRRWLRRYEKMSITLSAWELEGFTNLTLRLRK